MIIGRNRFLSAYGVYGPPNEDTQHVQTPLVSVSSGPPDQLTYHPVHDIFIGTKPYEYGYPKPDPLLEGYPQPSGPPYQHQGYRDGPHYGNNGYNNHGNDEAQSGQYKSPTKPAGDNRTNEEPNRIKNGEGTGQNPEVNKTSSLQTERDKFTHSRPAPIGDDDLPPFRPAHLNHPYDRDYQRPSTEHHRRPWLESNSWDRNYDEQRRPSFTPHHEKPQEDWKKGDRERYRPDWYQYEAYRPEDYFVPDRDVLGERPFYGPYRDR